MSEPTALAVARRTVGLVRVTGSERLAFLHTLLSQHVADLAAGQVRDFLFLDAKGGARAAGRLVARDDDVLLAVAPEAAEALAETLANSTFLMDAGAEALGGWTLASARGPADAAASAPDAATTTDGAALPASDAAVPPPAPALPALDGASSGGAPDEPMTAALEGDLAVIRDRRGGVDWLGPDAAVAAAVAASGLAEADPAALEAWRIAAGEPGWGSEIAAGRRTQELGLLPTHVHLDKGCYPGQESIAKTYNLGRPRRALCVVDLDAPVEVGATVTAGDKTGEVTSAAATDAGAVALCLLPLDRDGAVRGGGTVTVDGVDGRVRRRVGEGEPIPGA